MVEVGVEVAEGDEVLVAVNGKVAVEVPVGVGVAVKVRVGVPV